MNRTIKIRDQSAELDIDTTQDGLVEVGLAMCECYGILYLSKNESVAIADALIEASEAIK